MADQFDISDPLGLNKKPKSKDKSIPSFIKDPNENTTGFDISDPFGLKQKPTQKIQSKPSILGKAPVSDQPVKIRVNGKDQTIIDEKRVLKLQSQTHQLEEQIRNLEASGQFNSTPQRQQLANNYLQLQKMQGQPQQIGGVAPRTEAQMTPDARGIWHTGGYQLTEDKPKADPFDKLRFSYKAFKRMLDNGDNIVETRDGQSIPRNVAERQVSKVTGHPGPFQGAPLQNQRENQILEQGMAPTNAFTEPNPNQQRFSTANKYIAEIGSTLGQVYQQATGLSPEDAPYAHAALDFLGGLVTTPIQVAKGAAFGVQHPVQALQNTPQLLGEAVQSLNVFDPNISGSERFGRFLNAAFAVGGGAHFHSFIKRSIADGSIFRLGAKLGLSEAATTRDAIDFLKKQHEIHGSNLDNSNRLGQLDLNQSKRNLAQGKFDVDDPLGLHAKPEVHAPKATEAPKAPKPSGKKAAQENGAPTPETGSKPPVQTPIGGKIPEQVAGRTVSPVTYDEYGQPIKPQETDPFGLGIPVDHNTEGIHPTPQFERKPTLPTHPDDVHAANEQILDQAVRQGLKPEAADYVEQAAEDYPTGHIHSVYSPDQLEAVAKSKLSGRRQIKALDWLAANRITDPELIRRGVATFEENAVRFTPSDGRQVDEHLRRANTSPETADVRGPAPQDTLDNLVKEQLKRDAVGRAQEVPKPEAPKPEVPKTPEAKPETPKAPEVPKAPKEKKPKAPKPEAPKPEVKTEAPPTPKNTTPKTLHPDTGKLTKVQRRLFKHMPENGVWTSIDLAKRTKYKDDGFTQGSAHKALLDAKNVGILDNPESPGEFTLTEKGKTIKATLDTLEHGIGVDERPDWVKPSITPAAMTIDGWHLGDVNGKPWFTNTHFALEGKPAGPTSTRKPTVNIDRVVPDSDAVQSSPIKPVGISRGGDVSRLWFNDGTPLNLSYYDFIKKQYPKAEFYRQHSAKRGQPSDRSLVVKVNGEIKGVVMPMSADPTPEGIRGILDQSDTNESRAKDSGKNFSAAPPKIPQPAESLFAAENTNAARPKNSKPKAPPAPTPPTPSTPPPTPKEAGFLRQAGDSLKRTFAPMMLGEGGKSIGLRLREHFATIAAQQAKDAYSLKQAHDWFAKRSPKDNYEFIQRMEAGDPQGDPELDKFAKQIRKVLDTKRAEVQALGKGLLTHYYTNYFPHLWEKPGVVSEWVKRLSRQKRPLEGSKSAFKKRSIPTMEEGLAKGFKPISDNPVDMVLAHAHQMDMFINAQKLLAEMKETGQVKYLRVGAPIPDGYSRLDDKLFQVNHNGIMLIHEAFDEKLFEKLHNLAHDLGVRTSRKVSLKGHPDAWGLESKAGIETKFGGPETVLTHELGHAIDRKFGLRRALFQGPQRDVTLAEMKKLAALRYEGSTVSKSYQRYTEKQQEMVANLVHAYVHAPHLLERIAPETTKLFDKFIDARPKLKALRDLKPSLVLGTNDAEIRAPGVHTLGHYVAPSDVAAVMNNALAKGIRQTFVMKNYMALNNGMNQLNLGFSGFHYATTGFNSMISEMALGFEQAMRGQGGKALGHMAMGLNPYTPVRDFIKGGQIKDAFLQGIGDPKMRTIIDGIIKGGGRISEPEMYTNEATKAFKTAMGRNEVWGMIRKALPAAAEYSSKHLMQQVVPRVKLGAFSQLLQAELDNFKGPLTDDEFRDMAAKAWDSIDNRFGQLVYDNVFWHPLVKDLSMATVRSLGWSLGTLRELGMGGIDAAQGLGNQALKMSGKEPLKNTNVGVSHRTAYAMALPITMGVYGAMTQYLLTGKMPSRMRDYYFPLTGRKNADGTEERLSLPSYMKDFWGYTQDTAGTLKSKMSPLLSELLNVATNSDYFGNKIRAEDDPWYKQGLSLLKHVGGSVEPFTLSQVAQQVRDTGKFNVLSFAGFNKASAALSKTKAIEMAQHYAYEQVPKGKRTTEQAFRQQQLSQVVGMFRNGEKSDAQSKMRDLKVTPTEAKYIYSHAQGELLPKLIKSLSIDQALRVYEAGTVQEKKSIVRDVEKKLFNATQHNKQNFSIEDFRDFQKRLRAATPH